MVIQKKTIKPAEKEYGQEMGHYWMGPTFSVHKKIQVLTDRYKQNYLKKMFSIDPSELKLKSRRFRDLPDDLVVSVKRDGGYYLYYYDVNSEPLSIFCNSPNARALYNLPASREIEENIARVNESGLFEFKNALKNLTGRNFFEVQENIWSIVLTGELFANIIKENDRPRVFDLITLMRNPVSMKDVDAINYDIFDILSINGMEVLDFPYDKRLKIAELLFPPEDGLKANIIEHEKEVKHGDIIKLFGKWVEKQNHEGLVIRTKFGDLYKVKNVFDLDAVIIGYVEMAREKTLGGERAVSSVLLALMRSDGTFQELCRMGGGFTYEQRVELFHLIKDDIVESTFHAAKGDGRAYHFVRPKHVVQIKYMDLVTEGILGEPIRRMAIKFEDDKWTPIRSVPFVSVISPRYDVMRSAIDNEKYPSLAYVNPKDVTYQDLKIEQVLDLVPIDTPATVQELEDLPQSKILFKVVFQGKWAGVLSAEKIILWATNKHEFNTSYPNYVVYHGSYSHTRSKPLVLNVYPFISLDKAIFHINWIFKRPDNPIKGFFDKTGTKLKKSLVAKPYKLEVEEAFKPLLLKGLENEIESLLFEGI